MLIFCRGCDIVINDVNQELAEGVAKEIESLGRKSIAVKADISKPGEVFMLYVSISSEKSTLQIYSAHD